MQRMLRTALLVALFAIAPPAHGDKINKGFLGTAVKGYDVVAYHTEGAPRRGSRDFRHEWQDATWHFASAENRDRFAADPERYAPRYGGFCAYAVSQGVTADIDPHAWRIVDGRLYLNLNPGVQAIWEQDIPGYIAKADAHWPALSANE